MKGARGFFISACAVVLAAGGAVRADDSTLKDGDYVAVVGDSITEQKLYSVMIEDYLLMCQPHKLTVSQFGWSGETSWGFAARMQNDMLPFGTTVATTCYGMNDGGYSPEDPAKEKRYHDAQTDVVQQMKKGGVRFIVVGSPGCVDSKTFRHDPAMAVMYNKVLATERDIAKQVAQEQGVTFADVYDPMYEVMEKIKAKYGKDYPLAGGDGVHPGPNGHLIMAYAFLKGLGCDGNIGTITVDLVNHTATGTDGHKILSDHDDVVEIESTRYPFCFFGDPKTPDATTGVIDFLPFNQDLNRFTLVVTGADAGKNYDVTWGSATKRFSGDALAKGINLAAEFLDSPFKTAFMQVQKVVQRQQNFETPLVKQLIHDLPAYESTLPEKKDLFEKLRSELVDKDKPLREEAAKSVEPVKHSIKVTEAP
jgi:lysophospholipase L1-like esterase